MIACGRVFGDVGDQERLCENLNSLCRELTVTLGRLPAVHSPLEVDGDHRSPGRTELSLQFL